MKMKIIRYVTGPIQVNTYLTYDEEQKVGFLVDPGAYASEITEKINELGVDLKYIILTHGHGDHIGGVEGFLKDFPAAKVVADQDEKEMLQNGSLNSSVEMFGRPIEIDADLYVKDKDTLNVGSMELTFLHTPGHTKGGMSIYVDGHLFSGDTLFRYSIGRTDFYGGDFSVLMNSIKDTLFLLPDDTIVLPGHMELTRIGDEKRGNPFV